MIGRNAILLLCFLLLIGSLPADGNKVALPFSKNHEIHMVSSTNLEVHTSIAIWSDADFLDYGFNGTGSMIDPYIIEALNITDSQPQGAGISIRYTTAYFVIRDCFIQSVYIGIECYDVSDGTGMIINNTCTSISGDGGGVVLSELRNCTIEGNRLSRFGQGIHLNHADRCTISGNNISDNSYQGINIRYSDYNQIFNNCVVNSSQHGLAFVGTSTGNVVYRNNFTDNANEATYRIDGERTGNITSQGYDEGTNNRWYDEEDMIGNWWSDLSDSYTYSIDGPSDAIDLYPITDNDHGVSSDQITLIVLVVVVPVIVLLVCALYRIRRHNM